MTQTKEVWPKVEIGTHFAVMEYEDGTHEMYWDDESQVPPEASRPEFEYILDCITMEF